MSQPLKLEILRPDKSPSVFDIEPGVYTIGRDNDCMIHLNNEAVEPRHAILTVGTNGNWIEDLGASAGTFLNGKRIEGRRTMPCGQPLLIGPFTLIMQCADNQKPSSPPASTQAVAAAAPAPVISQTASQPAVPKPEPIPVRPTPAQPPKPTPNSYNLDQRRSIKMQIHKALVERLDIKRLSASRIKKEELRDKAITTIKEIVAEASNKLPAGMDPNLLIKEICDEALGLGPIEDLLEDQDVTEIMVNGPNYVYVERKGKLVQTDKTFMDEASVLAIIERIVAPLGRRIDESQPYVDARLVDGSRVNAVIHPLSLVGPCLTIRKFSKTPFIDSDLIRFGTWTPSMAEFAEICVRLRKNIVVSGGTGSGKTTLLNVLGNYLPADERIVTIEDAAELRLIQEHVVRLEARPPNIEGKGAITIRDLVRNSLRMRPDRIVVGECRGGEALDMLQAMNTGHDGSLTTVHANSPRDVISRLETMVLMSGMELPVRAIREQIASAVDVIVHESRMSDGSRKITSITEVVGLEGEQITMQEIFEYKQTAVDAEGKVVGTFRPTGSVPTFVEEIAARGLTMNRGMFDPRQWKE